MGAPLSWKWKLTIAGGIFFLFMIGWVFSPQGHAWMKQKIINAYNETPDEEKRASPWADRYLTLAWWTGSIRGDDNEAMDMYLQFCGMGTHKAVVNLTQQRKLDGLCSPDGKTGWGPLHPRAPEAYFNYMEISENITSGQRYQEAAEAYYRLFYLWMIYYSPDKKPHPWFNNYWKKIRNKQSMQRWYPSAGIDPRAPLAAPPQPDE